MNPALELLRGTRHSGRGPHRVLFVCQLHAVPRAQRLQGRHHGPIRAALQPAHVAAGAVLDGALQPERSLPGIVPFEIGSQAQREGAKALSKPFEPHDRVE